MKKKNTTQYTESPDGGRPPPGLSKNNFWHDFFFSKQRFHRYPENPCGYSVCLFVCVLSPCRTEVTILSTNQWTACVFGTLSDHLVPIGAAQSGSDWLSALILGPWLTFGGGNTSIRGPGRTEPSRNARGNKAVFLLAHSARRSL